VFIVQGEWHLPGHNFTGPGTRLKERLERGDEPVNRVDELSLHHDIRYQGIEQNDSGYFDLVSDYETINADVRFIGGSIEIAVSPSSTWEERWQAALVGGLMTIKLAFNFTGIGGAYTRFKRIKKKLDTISVIT
jgi:hypothetical protein